jgi:hypothetical protein
MGRGAAGEEGRATGGMELGARPVRSGVYTESRKFAVILPLAGMSVVTSEAPAVFELELIEAADLMRIMQGGALEPFTTQWQRAGHLRVAAGSPAVRNT